jgi:hypothetical protein
MDSDPNAWAMAGMARPCLLVARLGSDSELGLRHGPASGLRGRVSRPRAHGPAFWPSAHKYTRLRRDESDPAGLRRTRAGVLRLGGHGGYETRAARLLTERSVL